MHLRNLSKKVLKIALVTLAVISVVYYMFFHSVKISKGCTDDSVSQISVNGCRDKEYGRIITVTLKDNIDNYYAALISGGFDTSSLNSKTATKSKSTAKKYLSSTNADNDLTGNEPSDDIAAFRKVLQEERDVYHADGEVTRTPVYKILGWDIDDTSTWKGVGITNGAVTSIALPPVHLGGVLNLSGLDKLESLKCIYTGFEEIKLDGCKALKELILCDNAVTGIDLSSCDKLEYVNVSDNELKKIHWGSYGSLTRFNCTGNCLDTDTDEELLSVIAALKEKGSNPLYKTQRYDESAEFSPADIAFVKEFLAYGENEKLTGWDPDDMSTWSGIQWKTAGGMNHINRIEITGKRLTGELVLSDLKYIREVVCGGNKFTLLDVSGCSALEQLSCFGGELETLILGGNDKLLYLDCRNNCLMVEDIEAECKTIASRKGSEVYYERQYINAGREAFCEDECAELERFATLSGNKEILNWDPDRPGRIPQIQWEVCDGEYRVREIDLAGCDVKGTLDLSGFSALKSIGFAATKINGVIFPEHLKRLPDNAFINCRELTEVRLPSELVSIGKTAFYNCEKLERIDLPDGLEEIQDEAFTNCEGLTEITFGKNLKILGNHAFAGCTSLAKATFTGDAPGLPGSDLFYGTPDEFAICYDKTCRGWDGSTGQSTGWYPWEISESCLRRQGNRPLRQRSHRNRIPRIRLRNRRDLKAPRCRRYQKREMGAWFPYPRRSQMRRSPLLRKRYPGIAGMFRTRRSMLIK